MIEYCIGWLGKSHLVLQVMAADDLEMQRAWAGYDKSKKTLS